MKTTSKQIVSTLAACLLVTAMVGTASAGSTLHLNKWKTTGACKDCDLSGLTIPVPSVINKTTGLENANLSGATFASGVNLSGYNLKFANFNAAIMNGANLSGADITAASFQATNFGTADLTGLTSTNTTTINFASADLKSAKKQTKYPQGAHFGKAKWTSSLTCDDDGTSLSGCKIKQKCPSPKSGFVDSTGNCAD